MLSVVENVMRANVSPKVINSCVMNRRGRVTCKCYFKGKWETRVINNSVLYREYEITKLMENDSRETTTTTQENKKKNQNKKIKIMLHTGSR